MRTYLDSTARSIIAAAAFLLVFQSQNARAQDPRVKCDEQTSGVGDVYFAVGDLDLNRPFECQSTKYPAPKFAGYYAPYAIQAALSYYSDHQIHGGPYDFGDESQVKKAQRVFRQWEYQFDSSSYVMCAKPGDKNCNFDRPDRWTLFSTDGLYYQVWARYRPNGSCSEVSIAFRGTVNSSVAAVLASWSSNAHGFSQFAHIDDEYNQVARRLGAVVEQIKHIDCYNRATQIVSVGHSLGGGLAELAAFVAKPGQIGKVFTFNGSPITAQDLVTNDEWNAHRHGLAIDRVYQKGEILQKYAIIRNRQQTPAFECHPMVRTVQVNAFEPGAPQTRFERVVNWFNSTAYSAYEEHGIGPLAAKLVEWTDERQARFDPLPVNAYTNCPTPNYQMLPPPPPVQEVASIYDGTRVANSDFARVTAQLSARSGKSAQRLRQAYGFAQPESTAVQPAQFGSIPPVMTEHRVLARKFVRTRHRAVTRSTQAAIRRAHA